MWFIYVAADWADISEHTHQTRENISETPLHTVSRKHVVQPGNRSKTLGLNVPQVSGQRDAGKCSAVQLVTVTAGLFFPVTNIMSGKIVMMSSWMMSSLNQLYVLSS